MPIPKPKLGMKEEDYISECMGDETMLTEYPEKEQRAAVCYKAWADKDKEEDAEMKSEHSAKIELNAIQTELKPVAEWQKIKVFPKGKVFIEKYGKEFDFSDSFLNEVLINLKNSNIPSVKMDKDHEYKENYAEFRNPEINDDGLYMEIRLNKSGVELVKNKVYTSISPSFGSYTDTKGNEYSNVLFAVSLTNFPALGNEVKPLAEQLELSNKKKQEAYKMGVVNVELGLKAEASEAITLEAVKALKLELSSKSAKITELENKSIELSKQLQAIEAEKLEKEAVAEIDKNIELGKVHPAVREIWINRYKTNKAEVELELSKLPEKSSEIKTAGNGIANNIELSVDDETNMVAMNLNPKERSDREIWFEAKRKNKK